MGGAGTGTPAPTGLACIGYERTFKSTLLRTSAYLCVMLRPERPPAKIRQERLLISFSDRHVRTSIRRPANSLVVAMQLHRIG
jgi:hypothetical protein